MFRTLHVNVDQPITDSCKKILNCYLCMRDPSDYFLNSISLVTDKLFLQSKNGYEWLKLNNSKTSGNERIYLMSILNYYSYSYVYMYWVKC